MDTSKFSKGLFFKMPSGQAPDFVLLNMAVRPKEFFDWCQQYLTADSNGFVNLSILRSKDGATIYGQVDTWKPNAMPKEESEAYHNRYQHPDAGVQASNEKTEAELFQTAMSDEENKRLAERPF